MPSFKLSFAISSLEENDRLGYRGENRKLPGGWRHWGWEGQKAARFARSHLLFLSILPKTSIAWVTSFWKGEGVGDRGGK